MSRAQMCAHCSRLTRPRSSRRRGSSTAQCSRVTPELSRTAHVTGRKGVDAFEHHLAPKNSPGSMRPDEESGWSDLARTSNREVLSGALIRRPRAYARLSTSARLGMTKDARKSSTNRFPVHR